MNKIVSNIEEGIKRTRNISAPPNAIRLNRKASSQFLLIFHAFYLI
ncbi:MAG: hypothetical protein IJX99_03560 [Clostridia bacterium]|nr:hypothetical protein [Clostridia bacterium]